MKTKLLLPMILLAAGSMLPTTDSFALGEIFKLKGKVTGEVCTNTPDQGDGNDSVYLRIDSASQLTVSSSAGMDQDAQNVVVEKSVLTGRRSAVFLASLTSDSGPFRNLAVFGRIKLNAVGGISKLSGTFVARKVASNGEDCMNTGTFTGKLQ